MFSGQSCAGSGGATLALPLSPFAEQLGFNPGSTLAMLRRPVIIYRSRRRHSRRLLSIYPRINLSEIICPICPDRRLTQVPDIPVLYLWGGDNSRIFALAENPSVTPPTSSDGGDNAGGGQEFITDMSRPSPRVQPRRTRTIYTAEFKLRVVHEALQRPEAARIK